MVKYLFISLIATVVLLIGIRKKDDPNASYKIFNQNNIAFKSDEIAVGNKKMHYVQTGVDTATTLLFIHGSPGDWTAFGSYLSDSDLVKKYRLIGIDRIGFGQSSPEPMSIYEQEAIIAQLMTQKNNGKGYTLIGHSLGGPLAALIGATLPHMTNALLVIGGSVDPDMEKKELWRGLFTGKLAKKILSTDLYASNIELKLLKEDLKHLKPQLASIKAPFFVLHAENDMLVPFENVAFMKANIPSFAGETITKKGNHFIPFTNIALTKKCIEMAVKAGKY